jgi:hypothetical protein
MQLHSGSIVTISGPDGGTCKGRVAEILTPDHMPDLEGRPASAAAAVLAEWHVTRVAMISHWAGRKRQVVFAALEIEGQWYDMHRQPLTIEPAAQWEIN